MPGPATRALFGFIAAAVSVLTFHAAMWEVLHLLAVQGLTMPPAYPTDPVAPFGVPRILNLCFWGGLYGIVFALLMPRITVPLWVSGLALGVAAVLVGSFIVPAVKGLPIGNGWIVLNWVRSLLINCSWGIGVAIILSLMIQRRPRMA
jgi:hypothetical protein